jgi:hypothetical protein
MNHKKDKRDRVEELIEKILNKTIHPNEIDELKELTEPKKDENESRLNTYLVDGGNGISFYTTKYANKRKRNTYYVNKNNWILTKQFIIDNYFGGHCYRFNEQIKQYSIVSISQSELLKSNGKYKLSPDVNLEVMVTRMHKKIIKNETRLPKPE